MSKKNWETKEYKKVLVKNKYFTIENGNRISLLTGIVSVVAVGGVLNILFMLFNIPQTKIFNIFLLISTCIGAFILLPKLEPIIQSMFYRRRTLKKHGRKKRTN